MIDVLHSGSHYKSDNGFKPGFFNAVEQHLAISLPNSGIKAKPHIESRIKTLKSDWSAVHDMLAWNGTSGFGWDSENHMLEAPQPVWQAYIQAHKNAAKLRGKKFPHYWDLCLVFGKDRANGRDAQTAVDIVSEISTQETEQVDETQEAGGGLDDFDDEQPQKNLQMLLEKNQSAEIIGAEIRGATNIFNRVFGTESNREELRNKLFEEMNKIEGLTIRECDRAVCKLAQNEELMVIFFKVDEDRKLGWVKNVLADAA
ncbi:hypothetical protein OROGR_009490 [Orobanche gracilis]